MSGVLQCGAGGCLIPLQCTVPHPPQIRLNEDTIQDVVQAADLLLLTDLKALCCEFLEGCIAAENCIGIRDFALHYCLHHVHYLATEYLETHFRDVSSTEEFLELSPQKLKEVISLEKLNVGNERYVFEAVIRWIAHDTEIRKVPTFITRHLQVRTGQALGGEQGRGAQLLTVLAGPH